MNHSNRPCLASASARRSLLALLLALVPLPAQDAAADALPGVWQGALTVQGSKLQIALHFAAKDGGYTATLDSLSQGAEGIPVERVTRDGDDVTVDVKAVGGGFTLRLQKGSPDKLVGVLKQRGLELPIELERVAAVVRPKRPQEPKPPFPYRSEEVAFHHDPARTLAESFVPSAADGGVTLAGTLTLPEGEGPFPAAVLISGSGPQDRDETLLGHRPFLVLADMLTRAGCAVLRYDDRGTAKSTGSFRDATSADFARDALAAVRYLQTRPEIDGRRIGLIGHSEGGLIAPMVAAGDGKADVAFAVLIAPPGVALGEVVAHQSRLINAAEGMGDEDRAVDDAVTDACIRIIGNVADPARRKEELDAAVAAGWEKMSPAARQNAGGSLAAMRTQIARMDTPWMRYVIAKDPAMFLREMACPTLALFGGKDLQVDPAQNEPALRKAFTDGGKVTPTIVVLPDHNHLFQRTATGKPSEYAELEETFAPDALEAIRAWVTAHVLVKR